MEAELENARKEIADLQTKLRASEEGKMAMREACNRECKYLQEQIMRLQQIQAESSAIYESSQMISARIRPHDTPTISAVRKPGL
jgi:hypothetical protein